MFDNQVAYRKIRRECKFVRKFTDCSNYEATIEIWYKGTTGYRVTMYNGKPMVIEKIKLLRT